MNPQLSYFLFTLHSTDHFHLTRIVISLQWYLYLSCNWRFIHILRDLAVLCSGIPITTHSLCMIQPATTYWSHITLDACKMCSIHISFSLCSKVTLLSRTMQKNDFFYYFCRVYTSFWVAQWKNVSSQCQQIWSGKPKVQEMKAYFCTDW